ncbi:hypothetical protein [Jejuia spongiicola]|uniref:Uncharacterized protein n=1 Tax=Jejuia spongiicola TaxID=2942207 RepID=A0ABT0QDZ1_9FLAO|nr:MULTISPECIES: hypothetical protein [Flavobacteriaceae]MCL6294828.1 hypothetical protein [Jejuia spongiicola]
MEDILIGIIKFFGSTIDVIIDHFKTKKALLVGFIILIVCLTIVYILTKDF